LEEPHAQLPSLSFHHGETIDMLRSTVQQFAADEIAPRAADDRPHQRVPARPVAQDGRPGLLGITVTRSTAAPAMGYLAHVVAMEEISRASASVGCRTARIRTCASTRSAATAARRRSAGTCQAHQRRARGRARDERARARIDVVSMRLRADRKGDRYVHQRQQDVDHQRPDADTLVVYAKTDAQAGPKASPHSSSRRA
jgi:isovaleryl-CoA dehydrogenase